MNLLEEFYITIWDNNFNILGVIDTIETLEIKKCLSKAGTFTLTVPLTLESVSLLKVGNLITASNNIRPGYTLEPYVITYKQLSINSKGVEQLEIQGKSLFIWFNQRVLTQNYNMTDTIPNIIKTILMNECINPRNPNRIIPNLNFTTLTEITNKTTFLPQSQYSTVSSSITSILQSQYIGIQILMSPYQNAYIIELFVGKDYSLGNTEGNTPIIFSSDLNNIMGESFTHSIVNFSNVAYVYGTVDNKAELIITGDTETKGLNRVEIGVDGSDPTLNGEQFNLTSSNYQAIMTAAGEQTLANSEITRNFAGKLNMHTDLKYRLNFNVGDTISCINKEWSLNEDLIITEVTEQFSVQGNQITLSFGYPLPTLLEKINLDY